MRHLSAANGWDSSGAFNAQLVRYPCKERDAVTRRQTPERLQRTTCGTSKGLTARTTPTSKSPLGVLGPSAAFFGLLLKTTRTRNNRHDATRRSLLSSYFLLPALLVVRSAS